MFLEVLLNALDALEAPVLTGGEGEVFLNATVEQSP